MEDPPNSLLWEGVIRSTWEGGALGGVEEGWSRTPPLLLEPVLGGVHSPSVVASPGWWPAAWWWPGSRWEQQHQADSLVVGALFINSNTRWEQQHQADSLWSALNNREEVSFLLCFEVWEEFKTRQGGAKGRRRRRSCKSESLSYCEFL